MAKESETVSFKIDRKSLKFLLAFAGFGGGGFVGWDHFWEPYQTAKAIEINEHKNEMKVTRAAVERVEYAVWVRIYQAAGYSLDSAIQETNGHFSDDN